MRTVIFRGVMIVFAVTWTAAVSFIVYRNVDGYCHSQERYLSDADMIRHAIRYSLERPPRERVSSPDIIQYSSVEEFMEPKPRLLRCSPARPGYVRKCVGGAMGAHIRMVCSRRGRLVSVQGNRTEQLFRSRHRDECVWRGRGPRCLDGVSSSPARRKAHPEALAETVQANVAWRRPKSAKGQSCPDCLENRLPIFPNSGHQVSEWLLPKSATCRLR